MTELLFILLQQQDLLLRSDKIWSVMAVIGVIFAGLLIYLLSSERKLSKLEEKVKKLENKE